MQPSVLSFFLNLRSHLPVVKCGLLPSQNNCPIDGLQIPQTRSELLPDEVLLQLMPIFQTQSVMISLAPPVMQNVFDLTLEPPGDGQKRAVQKVDLRGGVLRLLGLVFGLENRGDAP